MGEAKRIKAKKPVWSTRAKNSLEECAEALRASGGFITHAARMLGVVPGSLSVRVKNHPELQAVIEEVRERHLDLAESALMSKVGDKDLGAICFYLKCQGKQRGYIERQDIHQKVDGKLEITWQES